MREQDAAMERYNFYNDSRTINSMVGSPFERIDESRMVGIYRMYETEVVSGADLDSDDLIDLEAIDHNVCHGCTETALDACKACPHVLEAQQNSYEVEVEVSYEVPLKFDVCPACHGAGKMIDPAIDAGGISQEAFDEDPDFFEDYQNGFYDVCCSTCKGNRVVPVWDRSKTPAKVLQAIDEDMAERRSFARQWAMELAMGC